MKSRRKLYCYVDESGQDDRSAYFVVAAVVVHDGVSEAMLQAILNLESASGTGSRKWHSARKSARISFVDMVLAHSVFIGSSYFSRFQKPLAYFSAVVSAISESVSLAAGGKGGRVIVVIDGVDGRTAAKYTYALRKMGVHLDFVRGKKDETEPFIRLADRWAGCIRAALLGNEEASDLMVRALKLGHLQEVQDVIVKKDN